MILDRAYMIRQMGVNSIVIGSGRAEIALTSWSCESAIENVPAGYHSLELLPLALAVPNPSSDWVSLRARLCLSGIPDDEDGVGSRVSCSSISTSIWSKDRLNVFESAVSSSGNEGLLPLDMECSFAIAYDWLSWSLTRVLSRLTNIELSTSYVLLYCRYSHSFSTTIALETLHQSCIA